MRGAHSPGLLHDQTAKYGLLSQVSRDANACNAGLPQGQSLQNMDLWTNFQENMDFYGPKPVKKWTNYDLMDQKCHGFVVKYSYLLLFVYIFGKIYR